MQRTTQGSRYIQGRCIALTLAAKLWITGAGEHVKIGHRSTKHNKYSSV
jgi:hypothetical protein